MSKPPRPQAAYFSFSNEIKAKQPTLSAKQIAELWHGQTDEVKARYLQTFQKDYAEYQVALAKYYDQFPEEKIKDQEAKSQQRLQKQASSKSNLSRILFTVAHLKKYQVQIPCSEKLLQMLHITFNKLQESEKQAWYDLWSQIDGDKRGEITSFYEEWKGNN